MNCNTTHYRANSSSVPGDPTSRIALGIALAGGVSVALASPAQAQRQQQQQQQGGETLSRNFQPVYQSVANATNTTGDFAGAKAQVPALIAAISSEYDRFFAGNIMLQLGVRASDRALQKQGLEMMLQSGKGTPADTGLFRYLLGTVNYDSGDYAGALREAQASVAAGFAGNFAEQQDPWGLMVDSYIRLNRAQEGLAMLRDTISQRLAAGQEVRPEWLPRALAIAAQQNMLAEAADLAALLVQTNPTPDNWQKALQVVGATSNGDAKVQLDVMRLMAITNSMKERNDYIRYIEVADPRIMSNEVARVLAAGVQSGLLTTGEQYYTDVKRVVDANASRDQSEAPQLASEARAAGGTARAAQNAGDVFLSLGKFAEAEEMYALGLQKPGAERDLLLTRLGIAQAQQGKNAEAKATFGQVSGNRAALARLWSAYVDSRA